MSALPEQLDPPSAVYASPASPSPTRLLPPPLATPRTPLYAHETDRDAPREPRASTSGEPTVLGDLRRNVVGLQRAVNAFLTARMAAAAVPAPGIVAAVPAVEEDEELVDEEDDEDA